MKRGQRALQYHAFSAAALTMLAYMGRANGVDLYSRGDRALSKVTDIVTT